MSCKIERVRCSPAQTLFTRKMLKFLKTIFRNSTRLRHNLSEEDIDKAIETLVSGTDPRLRMIGGYQKKLRMPVIRALLYIQGLDERVPGPFAADRKAYGADPQINALFGSVQQLQELFSLNEKMKAYFEANPDQDVAYASLGMLKREKKTFGAALFGNIVRKDIAQIAVNFSGHWIGVCAPSIDEAKAQMRARAFNSLVDTALERITDIKSTTQALERERAMLRVKLRETRAQNRGLDSLVDDSWLGSDAWQQTQERLAETEQKLKACRVSLATLDDYLLQISRVLAHPARHLKVKGHSIRINRMGIKAAESDDRGNAILTAEITIAKKKPFNVILVTYPRAEMLDSERYHKMRV